MRNLKWLWLTIIAITLFSTTNSIYAQNDNSSEIDNSSSAKLAQDIALDHQLLRQAHSERFNGFKLSTSILNTNAATKQNIDVKHYLLQITLEPKKESMSGTVTINGTATDNIDKIKFNALDNLTIDDIKFNDQAISFQKDSDNGTILLPQTLTTNSDFTMQIKYHGYAVADQFLGGGMLVSRHGLMSDYVMASLSEPYAAPTWWPCIDDVADKALVDVEITAPGEYLTASNGLLKKVVKNGNGTRTSFWHSDYPLSTYLVSVAATNYVTIEDTYTARNGDTMPIVHYVYPEDLKAAQEKFAITVDALGIYAKLFGEYPFIKEKYGMAAFPWGGAMEHQTMTSINDRIVGSAVSSGKATIVHELAHQWWGDLVTNGSWHDLWLNEGFATYSEVLFFERFENQTPGKLMSRAYDDHRTDGQLRGTVYAEDLADPFDDVGALYDKGAWVLHMLRHVMGDEQFFTMLKDYREQYSFGNATTRDFQKVCEAHYGSSLDWFFNQWVFTPLRPGYRTAKSITKNGNQYKVDFTIEQTQTHAIFGRDKDLPSLYIMPVDITLHFADGTKEVHKVMNDQRSQQFSFTADKKPTKVIFDEGDWLLKSVVKD